MLNEEEYRSNMEQVDAHTSGSRHTASGEQIITYQRWRESASDELAHYVYVLTCADSSLYTGYTRDVLRRVAAHNAGKGARYTRSHRPVSLLIAWTFQTRSEALRAEYAVKHLSRTQKLHLIAETAPAD